MAGLVNMLRSQLLEAREENLTLHYSISQANDRYRHLLEDYQDASNELGEKEVYVEQLIRDDPVLFIFKHLQVSNNDQPARIIAQMLTPEAIDRMIDVAYRIEDIGEDMLNRPRPPVPAGPPALANPMLPAAPQSQDDDEALDNFQTN